MTDENLEVNDNQINDVFTDEEVKSEETESTDKTEASKVDASTDTESEAKAETDEKVDQEAETTTAENNDSVPLAALMAERDKRQAIEKKLEELTKEEPKKEEIPDQFEDQDGYNKFMLERGDTKLKDEALNLKTTLSREFMLENYKDDYEQMEKTFYEIVGQDSETGKATKNLHLVDEMNAHPAPAKFVYQTAKDHLEIQAFRDPAFKENMRKEILEELKAESEGKTSSEKTALNLPKVTQTSAAGTNSQTVKDEGDLASVFAD